MNILIRENDLFTKQNSKPEAFFDKANHDAMLLYHNEHDVFTAEGLLKWQHKIFNQASGFIWKFRANKQFAIDINTRQKLKAMKDKSNKVMISADMSYLFYFDWRPTFIAILLQPNSFCNVMRPGQSLMLQSWTFSNWSKGRVLFFFQFFKSTFCINLF